MQYTKASSGARFKSRESQRCNLLKAQSAAWIWFKVANNAHCSDTSRSMRDQGSVSNKPCLSLFPCSPSHVEGNVDER